MSRTKPRVVAPGQIGLAADVEANAMDGFFRPVAGSAAPSSMWRQMRVAIVRSSIATTGPQRRITRWEHEQVLEAVQKRLDETHRRCGRGARRSSIRSAR